ncbi:MAG: hypothetical protein IKX88_00890 [Thermoguttaceae bacterium]|nr:hypothetical protein [Thermoguttaceae bacterium]MBR5757135.1 hypothetical protein [Thermoguttaceae bacterium]
MFSRFFNFAQKIPITVLFVASALSVGAVNVFFRLAFGDHIVAPFFTKCGLDNDFGIFLLVLVTALISGFATFVGLTALRKRVRDGELSWSLICWIAVGVASAFCSTRLARELLPVPNSSQTFLIVLVFVAVGCSAYLIIRRRLSWEVAIWSIPVSSGTVFELFFVVLSICFCARGLTFHIGKLLTTLGDWLVQTIAYM